MQQREAKTRSTVALPSPEQIEAARLLYESGHRVELIAESLGWNRMAFYRFRLRNGWQLRATICKPKAPLEDPVNVDDLIERLERTVQRELIRAEKALARTSPHKAEARSRTVTNLVKALATTEGLRRGRTQNEAPPQYDRDRADDRREATPQEMAELRAELARRLDRFAAEGAFE